MAVTNNDVSVSNGLFTVSLDFGSGIFTGSNRWLAVSVRAGTNTGSFTALSPRQAITPAPYAQYAMTPAGPQGAQGPPVSFQGTWLIGVTYAAGDAVFFNGSSYISLSGGNTGNTPTSGAPWALLAQQGSMGTTGATGPAGTNGAPGATGPQGPPVRFQGTWLIGVTYAAGDAVFFNGSSYISLSGGNTGNTPTSGAPWALLAQQGSTGATGPAGTNGAAGATGPQGPPVTFQGTWSNLITYGAGDTVFFTATGSSYISLHAGNINHSPPTSPADWSLLAQQGSTGATGAAGTTGQTGSSAFGSASLTATNSTFYLIPGLTRTISVPTNALLYIATDGGVVTTASATNGYSELNVAVFVDGSSPATGAWSHLMAANTGAGISASTRWAMSYLPTLSVGSHTIEVRASLSGGSNATVSGSSASVHQGELTVLLLNQ